MSKARQAIRLAANCLAVIAVAAGIFVALGNAGIIGRYPSETVTFGG